MKKKIVSFAILVCIMITALQNIFIINVNAMGDYSGNLTGATWYWPIHGYSTASSAYSRISSSYGYRGVSSDGTVYNRNHYGVDIGESRGTAVYPTRNGTVYLADNSPDGSEGRSIIINHGDGYYSAYYHLSSVNVSGGQSVDINTQIGAVGGSGYNSETCYSSHLHLAIHYGSSWSYNCNVNPCPSGYTRVGASFQASNGGHPEGSASISYLFSNSVPSEPVDPPTNVYAITRGSKVSVSWEFSQNATSYDVYLIQAPWGWSDIKYSQNISGEFKYCEFYGVVPGNYNVFIVARPNADYVQSEWKEISVAAPSAPTINAVNPNHFVVGDNISISWSDPGNTENYLYYLTEYPAGYAYTTNTKAEWTTNTSVSFSNLSAGYYSMFIHACNDIGSSPQSNWVSFYVYDNDYVPQATMSFNGHVYAVYDYEMSWTFANDLANDMGGHLVTINSLEEDIFIKQLIDNGTKNAYWIGAQGFEDKDMAWVTGEPFAYTNWYPGEPSRSGELGEKEHWVEIRKSYDKKWNDVKNTSKANKGFIIELEPNEAAQTATARFGEHKYILIDENTTWTEASVKCNLLGGHIVTIDSIAERNFVDQFIENGKRSWYYLGAKKVNTDWKWINNTFVNNINWNPHSQYTQSWSLYLMEYKNTKDCIPMPNTYFPREINHIGYICEIDNYFEPICVSYNANEGINAPPTQTKTYATTLTLSSIKPNREGYTFKNWNTKADGTGTTYESGVYYSEEESVTLYAQWEYIPPYTETQVVKSGSSYNLSISQINLDTAKIIVGGYKNNILISTQILNGDSIVPINFTGDFDTFKVMAWENLSALKPLCEAETIPQNKWIME